jgi:predicted Zn-dependent protease
MLRRPIRPLLMMGALLLATSCGGEQKDYVPEIEPHERRLGAEQHEALLAQFGGSYDAPQATYIRGVGEKIAGSAGLSGECTFTLVNSDVVNAFAVPGCYIYITRGLMAVMNSEAELASVLAHEVGHIVADHGDRQQRRSLLRGLGVLAVSLITGSERLTQIAGGAAEFFTLRYSRGQEFESDALGIRYLAAAGYDPHAAADMLDALGRHDQFRQRESGREDVKSIPEWARTHPLTENRIERARLAAMQTGHDPGDLPELKEPYLRQVHGLLYGDDPEQGFVLGRRFAHPGMRIGFEVPQGFSMTNAPQAVLIDGPDGMRGEFAGGRLPAGGLEAYVEQLIGQYLKGVPAEAGAVTRASINGVPALAVPVLVHTQEGQVEISIVAYAPGGGSAYHFAMISSPGRAPAGALQRLFGSLRQLPPQEVASLRPRFIRVVEVPRQASAATLASDMASETPLDHFLMLNGKSSGERLHPGEKVKLVVRQGG